MNRNKSNDSQAEWLGVLAGVIVFIFSFYTINCILGYAVASITRRGLDQLSIENVEFVSRYVSLLIGLKTSASASRGYGDGSL